MDKQAKNPYKGRKYYTLCGGSAESSPECEDPYDEDLDWFERDDEEFAEDEYSREPGDFRLNVLDRILKIAKRNERLTFLVAAIAGVGALALLISWWFNED